MESEKFDELIKRMGTGRMSRLTALRGLAGGVTAAAAGVLLAKDEAEGKKSRKAKARRRKNKRRGAQLYVPTPAPVAPIPTPHVDPYSCAGAKECPAGTGQVWDIYDPKCPCVCGAGQTMCENTYDSYKKGMCVPNKCETGWHYEPTKCKCVEDDDNGGGDGQKCASVTECTVGNATAVACCDEGQEAVCYRRTENRLEVGICEDRGATPVPADECSILDPRCPTGTTCCGTFPDDPDGTCVRLAAGTSCDFPIPGEIIGGTCELNSECTEDNGGVCCIGAVLQEGGAEVDVCVRGAALCRTLGGEPAGGEGGEG